MVPMLNLIPFAPAHFALLSSWFDTEADIVQWAGPFVSFPLSSDQLEGMLDEGRTDPPQRLCWMAEKAGDLVGHAQLSFDWRNGNAWLSRVVIAPRARGQRLAEPMVRLAIDEAFSFAAVERLELNVYAWNVPAIRTYERLGFWPEGTRRAATLVDGARWDTSIMSILRNDRQSPSTSASTASSP